MASGKRRTTKPWLTFKWNNAPWEAYLVPTGSEHLIVDGDECNAVTDATSRKVYVCVDHDEFARLQYLMHELIHVSFSDHTADLLASLFKCLPKDLHEVEENIAGSLGHSLAGLLVDAGLVRLGGKLR